MIRIPHGAVKRRRPFGIRTPLYFPITCEHGNHRMGWSNFDRRVATYQVTVKSLDLIIGLLRMCSDPGLEAFESQDDLKNELMRRVSQTDLKKNIMNSVYSLLHGLEEIEIPKFDEYVPEEPDWILNGRIKWLKRYV